MSNEVQKSVIREIQTRIHVYVTKMALDPGNAKWYQERIVEESIELQSRVEKLRAHNEAQLLKSLKRKVA